MFEKYSHKGTWSESLYIFLFVHIITNKSDCDQLSIEQYHNFELKDTNINSFNKWIDEGTPSSEILISWIERNSNKVEEFKLSFGTLYKPKVEIWSDRDKTGYYKEKLQASFEFENHLTSYFKEKYGLALGQYFTPEGQYYEGENKLGIEIKNDTLIKRYGNIYIEYAEKSNAANDNYVPSGILKDDKSAYFLIGDKDKFWVFRKKRLAEIYHEEEAFRKQNKPSERGIQFKTKTTSLGFVYPVKHAEKEALSLDVLVRELKSIQ